MKTQTLKRVMHMALTTAAIIGLSACGRASQMNQTQLPAQTTGTATYAGQMPAAALQTPAAYAYPTPQLQNNASTQANRGGRAVATPNGYVYEQNPTAQSAGYNFYNSQNPCLYPKPGQTVSCSGSQNGAYYAQQPSAYGQGYPTTPNYAQQPAYGQQTSGYPQAATYPQSNPQANSNYGTVPAYGSPTSGATNGAAPVSTYRAPVARPTVSQQTVNQSSADKARSRIDPRAGQSSKKKSVTF